MPKADIIAQLQRDILPLQGYKSSLHNTRLDVGLGPINGAFPSSVFPLGAVHEFFCNSMEELTASGGFISGILSSLLQAGGVALWISSGQTVFPPALKAFGIDPHKVIFINLKKEKELLWVTEEALKCTGIAAVVGNIADVSFTNSRRFQLAVEESGVTNFLLRRSPRNLTTACLCRWHVTSLATVSRIGLPGVGHPRWTVELIKVRGGKPGVWHIEWKEGGFTPLYQTLSMVKETQRKTGVA